MARNDLTHFNGVIVTGAAGWLGQAVLATIEKIELRFEVRCADFVKPTGTQTFGNNYRWFYGDLSDPEICGRVFSQAEGYLVLHLAGLIHPKLFVRDLLATNVRTLKTILSSTKTSGASRFVAMSSNSPFGVNGTPDDRFDEQSTYRPYMMYGRSKMFMEQVIFDEAEGDPTFDYAIVRAPWFYGTFGPHRQSRFFSMIRKGIFPIVGDGLNRRSMIAVDRLAEAILLIAENPSTVRDHFWVADRSPYTMIQIITTIQDILELDFGIEVRRRIPQIPRWLDPSITLADKALQSVGLYNQKVHVLSEIGKNICCSVDKFEKQYPFKAADDLSVGMRDAIAWHLSEPNNL